MPNLFKTTRESRRNDDALDSDFIGLNQANEDARDALEGETNSYTMQGVGERFSGTQFQGKGGTQRATQQARTLMDLDDAGRAAHLHKVLFRYQPGRNHFQQVLAWLTDSGGNAQVRAEFQRLTNNTLEEAIEIKVKHKHQKSYLLDVCRNGQPGHRSRVLLSLGKVTDTPHHSSELALLMELAPADERIAIWDELKSSFKKIGTKRILKRIKAAVEMAGAELNIERAEDDAERAIDGVDPLDLEALGEAADQANDAVKDAKTAHMEAKAKHLWRVFRQHSGEGLDKHKLANKDKIFGALRDFAASEDQQTRDYVVSERSSFYTNLRKLSKGPLSKSDLELVLNTIQHQAPLPEQLFAAPKRLQGETDEAYGERKAQDQQLHNANVHALVMNLNKLNKLRKENLFDEVDKEEHKKFAQALDALSDEELNALLFTLLPERLKLAWSQDMAQDDANVRHEHMRASGLRALRAKLEGGAMGKKDVASVLTRVEGLQPTKQGFLDTKGPYQKLRSVVIGFERGIGRGGAIQDALDLLKRMNGTERLYVRNDAELLDELRRLVKHDKKAWKRATTFLGIDVLGAQGRERAEEAGQADPRKFNEAIESTEELAERANINTGGKTFGQQTHEAEAAELQPEFWSERLNMKFERLGDPHRKAVYGLLTRAHYAGIKRAAQDPIQGSLRPMDRVAFAAEVQAGLKGDAKRRLLKSSKFMGAWQDFADGGYPSVDERIDQAKFTGKNRARRAKGNKYDQDALMSSFEDLEGADLLEEWSDIAAFRATRARQAELAELAQAGQADDDQLKELRRLNEEVRTYIPDIRADRFELLEGNLNAKTRMKVTTELRGKLRDAAMSDPAFQKALSDSGVINDTFLQERMRLLNALSGQQRFLDSSTQFDGITAKNTERKEARAITLGTNRGAKGTLDLQAQDDATYEQSRIRANNDFGEEFTLNNDQLEARTAKFEAVQDLAITAVTALIGIAFAVIIAAATAGIAAPVIAGLGVTAGTVAAVAIESIVGFVVSAGVIPTQVAVQQAIAGDAMGAHEAAFQIALKLGGAALGGLLAAGATGATGALGLAEGSFGEFALQNVIKTVGQGVVLEPIKHATDDKLQFNLPEKAAMVGINWVASFGLGAGAWGTGVGQEAVEGANGGNANLASRAIGGGKSAIGGVKTGIKLATPKIAGAIKTDGRKERAYHLDHEQRQDVLITEIRQEFEALHDDPVGRAELYERLMAMFQQDDEEANEALCDEITRIYNDANMGI